MVQHYHRQVKQEKRDMSESLLKQLTCHQKRGKRVLINEKTVEVEL